MTVNTKIAFSHRAVRRLDDVTDLVALLVPGNRNQQHAAARILLALKVHGAPLPALAELERQYGISRRTMERTRAKLAGLGLIEHIGWMNIRYGGREGWKLSSRMSTGLRHLADNIDQWRSDKRPERREKEEMLAVLLRP